MELQLLVVMVEMEERTVKPTVVAVAVEVPMELVEQVAIIIMVLMEPHLQEEMVHQELIREV